MEENAKRKLTPLVHCASFENDCFCTKLQTSVLNPWKGIFEKWQIILSITSPLKITSFSFFTGVMVWNIRMDLYNLFFRFKHLMNSCFSHYIWAWISRHWKEIFENWKRFLSRTSSFTKTLFFFTGVMVWNIRMDLYSLFFIFKYFMISCFSHYLWVQIPRHWKGIFEN